MEDLLTRPYDILLILPHTDGLLSHPYDLARLYPRISAIPYQLILGDVMSWTRCTHYWSFVRRVHQSSVNTPHKGSALYSIQDLFRCQAVQEQLNITLRSIWIWPRSGPAVFSMQSALIWLSELVSSKEQIPVCLGFSLYLFCIYMACFLYTRVLASISECFSWCPKYHLKDTNEIDRHPCRCETWMGSVNRYWWSWKILALGV